MAQADYYKILGIEKSASADEIKKAFRTLAVKYHPDRNQGDKQAEEKFKEINEAYAVLSDPDKKQQYDTFGSSGFHQQYSQEDIFRGFDFGGTFRDMGMGGGEDIFSRLFGRGGRGGFRGGPRRGGEAPAANASRTTRYRCGRYGSSMPFLSSSARLLAATPITTSACGLAFSASSLAVITPVLSRTHLMSMSG